MVELVQLKGLVQKSLCAVYLEIFKSNYHTSNIIGILHYNIIIGLPTYLKIIHTCDRDKFMLNRGICNPYLCSIEALFMKFKYYIKFISKCDNN